MSLALQLMKCSMTSRQSTYSVSQELQWLLHGASKRPKCSNKERNKLYFPSRIIASSISTRHIGHRALSRDCSSSVQSRQVTMCPHGENTTSLQSQR